MICVFLPERVRERLTEWPFISRPFVVKALDRRETPDREEARRAGGGGPPHEQAISAACARDQVEGFPPPPLNLNLVVAESFCMVGDWGPSMMIL